MQIILVEIHVLLYYMYYHTNSNVLGIMKSVGKATQMLSNTQPVQFQDWIKTHTDCVLNQVNHIHTSYLPQHLQKKHIGIN